MEKRTILIIILAILVISSFFIYGFIGDKEKKESGEERAEISGEVIKTNESNNELAEEDSITGNAVDDGSSSGASSVAGGGDSGIGDDEDGGTGINLPSDLETQPCGHYYGDYGACTGTCPEGTCVSEGMSCYCKRAW